MHASRLLRRIRLFWPRTTSCQRGDKRGRASLGAARYQQRLGAPPTSLVRFRNTGDVPDGRNAVGARFPVLRLDAGAVGFSIQTLLLILLLWRGRW